MRPFISIILLLVLFSAAAQNKTEGIQIDWPGEYNWKIVKNSSDRSRRSIVIIPGNESADNVSIIGTMTAQLGVQNSNLEEVITNYKNALDTGSILTVMEKQTNKQPHWVMFKIETPKTSKYPEPESDLYYVIQGAYALYENFVAIKSASLPTKFVEKWSKIFKSSRIDLK